MLHPQKRLTSPCLYSDKHVFVLHHFLGALFIKISFGETFNDMACKGTCDRQKK